MTYEWRRWFYLNPTHWVDSFIMDGYEVSREKAEICLAPPTKMFGMLKVNQSFPNTIICSLRSSCHVLFQYKLSKISPALHHQSCHPSSSSYHFLFHGDILDHTLRPTVQASKKIITKPWSEQSSAAVSSSVIVSTWQAIIISSCLQTWISD